ncbi:MAG: cell division ATP-binding protein FtsE [Deltaproteobacteria bacterium]|nr:cell division ATP-binding protein FtsE [Deltaproteobacteria bacterium]
MILFTRVAKRYPQGLEALSGVSFHLEKGAFLFVTGPSGAGKTTLVKLVLGVEKPTEGSVIVAGRNVSALRAASMPFLRRNVGVVFQDFRLLESRTVYQNVALGLEILGWSGRDIRARVDQLLERLGLERLARHRPREISGGEQQRVAIARALVNNPPIVLADEPTGSVDPDLAVEIMDLLVDAQRKGTTVLVATHNLALLERYDHPRIYLQRGRLVDGWAGPGRTS